MIHSIDKEIVLEAPPERERELFHLDTADGRFNLADRILEDINEWCKQAFDDGPRRHLGASVIGSECDRHIWYIWRWFKHPAFSGKKQRLFQDGHHYEDRFIQMLEGIGCKVSQVSEDGEQHHIYAVEGHFGGSLDSIGTLPERYGPLASTESFLCEFKTANQKNFTSLNHVEDDKPQHWAQMCVYGVQRQIRYALYFVVNKNDSDVKVFVLELDWAHGQRMISKGEWIIKLPVPPPRLSNNPSDWRCKMCEHYQVCFLGQKPDVNCRSCRYSEAVSDKQWRCNRWGAIIPNEEAIKAGCEAYEVIEDSI